MCHSHSLDVCSSRGVQWRFPLLVEAKSSPFVRKYGPKSDFSLTPPNFVPYVLGEVNSNDQETDRNRMILQSAAVVRIANALRKQNESPFVLLAIYLTKKFVVERYLIATKNVCTFPPKDPIIAYLD
jgi:hypothetical protein